jgi:hypothetical protein
MTGDASARTADGTSAAQVHQAIRDEHPAPARTEAMTDDFTDLEKLAREATPGEWRLLPSSFSPRIFVMQRGYGPDDAAIADVRDRTNADYIAAANPARVLALCAELSRLRSLLEPFACACTGRCERMEWMPADNSVCAYRSAAQALKGQSHE